MRKKKATISGEFRKRLGNLKPKDKVGVNVIAKLPKNLESALKEALKDLPKRNKSERREINLYYNEITMNPIIEYVKSKGCWDYTTTPNLRMVFSELTVKNIYKLSEQPYVKAIIENQKVKLTENLEK